MKRLLILIFLLANAIPAHAGLRPHTMGTVTGPGMAVGGSVAGALDGCVLHIASGVLTCASAFFYEDGELDLTGGPISITGADAAVVTLDAALMRFINTDGDAMFDLNVELGTLTMGDVVINAGTGEVTVNTLTAGDISASSITVGGLSLTTLNGGTVTAGVVTADYGNLESLKLTARAASPVTCGPTYPGLIYYDETDALCLCNGTVWRVVNGAGSCNNAPE